MDDDRDDIEDPSAEPESADDVTGPPDRSERAPEHEGEGTPHLDVSPVSTPSEEEEEDTPHAPLPAESPSVVERPADLGDSAGGDGDLWAQKNVVDVVNLESMCVDCGQFGPTESWSREDAAGEPLSTTETRARTRWPLPSDPPSTLHVFETLDFEVWAERLFEEHVVVISCAHPHIAISAMWRLLNTERLSPIRERTVNLADFRYATQSEAVAQGSEEVVVLAAHEELSHLGGEVVAALTDELLVPAVKLDLQLLSRYAIVVMSTATIHALRRFSRGLAPSLPRLHVPFLRPWVDRLCGGNAESCNLVLTRIENLQATGDWPREEEAFCEALRPYRDVDSLLEALERPNRLETWQPPEMSEFPRALRNAVLWAATFLTDLPAADFRDVLRVLLSGMTEALPPPPVSEKESKEEEQESETEKSEAPPPPQPRALFDIWSAKYEPIMKTLGLTFAPRIEDAEDLLGAQAGERDETLGFVEPFGAQRARRHFERVLRFDHIDNVDRVKRAGLLFHGSTPLVDRVVSLVVEMTRKRPEGFGRQWLLETVLTAVPDVEITQALGPVAQRVAQMIEQFDRARRMHVLQRMCMLMRRMYAHDELRTMVDRFLDEVLASKELRATLPEVIHGMRAVRVFDSLHWLRQLIERGHAEIAERARVMAFALLKGAQMWEHLAEMSRWIPLSSTALPPINTSGHYAVQAFLALMEASIDRPGYGEIGRWPPDNVVLRWLSQTVSENSAPFELLAEWLLHPASERVLAENFDRHLAGYLRHRLLPPSARECLGGGVVEVGAELLRQWSELANDPRVRRGPVGLERQFFIAIFLAEWATILQGLDREPPPEGTVVLDRVLQPFAGRVDASQARRLVLSWTTIESCLLAGVHAVSASLVAGRAARLRRRQALDELTGMRRRVAALRRRLGILRREKALESTRMDP